MSPGQTDRQDACAIFDRVYEQCRYTMLHVAMGVLHDQHLAEDAVQEAFIKVLQHYERFRDFPTPQTRNLALVIVRNKAIDLLRKQQGQTIPLEEMETIPEAAGPTPEEAFLAQQGYASLRAAIRSLKEQYRIALELKYIHGCSDQEMATLLDITPKNANVRVFRAKRALRERLEELQTEEKEALAE